MCINLLDGMCIYHCFLSVESCLSVYSIALDYLAILPLQIAFEGIKRLFWLNTRVAPYYPYDQVNTLYWWKPNQDQESYNFLRCTGCVGENVMSFLEYIRCFSRYHLINIIPFDFTSRWNTGPKRIGISCAANRPLGVLTTQSVRDFIHS